MKEAYCTILTSEDFAVGVRVLYRSVKAFSNKEFVVFAGQEVSETTMKMLQNSGITVFRPEAPAIPSDCISARQASDRWNKTLFKLVCFRPQGYDKLIYIDSDILVRASLDELFERRGLSAVPDREFYSAYGRDGMNAGVIVIEPSEELYDRLLNTVRHTAKTRAVFGDQDVINDCLAEWDQDTGLHLPAEYNTCFYDCERITEPKAVHFILESKPWTWSAMSRMAKTCKWLIKGRGKQIRYMREYMELLHGSRQ